MFYILHGEDEFSRAEQVAAFKEKIGDATVRDFNVTVLDGRKLTLAELRLAADSVPFMADKRLVVVEASARFHRPARYDDVVLVRTAVDDVSKATLTFMYEARLPAGTLLVEGQTVHAATDLAGRVRRMPDEVRTALGGGGRNRPAQRE